MKLKRNFFLIPATVLIFTGCKKDTDPIIVVPPSTGAQVQLNGLVGNEPGSSAGNSVYLDLSTNTAFPMARAGWDLGFYNGADFRVILNNFSSAGAEVTPNTDLNTIGVTDTIGLTLSVNQMNPQPSDLVFFDDIGGDITKTAIPAISSIESENKVIIINRGTGGSIPPRPWMKIRVLRNASGGYTLQYAGITATTYQSIQVPKDDNNHFTYVSFENGIVNAQPEKTKWDLVWSYSVFQTNFGAGLVPYNFSDLIAVNHLSNVQVSQKIYADEATALAAYTAFNSDSVMATTMVSGRWTIGSSWRSTQPATGVRKDRFYIIKDANGNFYKLKCLAMGVGSDGGVRGKPEFRYELID